MKLGKLFLLTGAFLVMTNIANAKLPGYTDGAELMQPKIENGQIDSMSGIVVNFQRFPTLDAKKLVNAPKMSAHHRGICHF